MGKRSMLEMNTNSIQLVHLIPGENRKMEVFSLSRVCHENYPFEEVNDINDFEARFLGGAIEWE